VCVETETETEAEGTSKEKCGQIRLPREVIDWQQVLEDVWKGLLTNKDGTVVVTSNLENALFFSNLFLQSLGYTPQRAALELQSVFELPEPPSFESSDCHCTLPKTVGFQFMRFKKIVETLRKDAHGTEKLLHTS